jgi:hypothetical protein
MPMQSNTNTEKCRHASMSEVGFKPTTSVFEEYKIVHASVHINHTTFYTVGTELPKQATHYFISESKLVQPVSLTSKF